MKPPPSARLIRGHRLAQDLVGLWPFNEGSGGQVIDLSGYNKTGTITGDYLWTPGQFGPCIELLGDADYIAIPALPITTELTYSIWFKTHLADTVQVLIRIYDTVLALSHAGAGDLKWYPDADLVAVSHPWTYATNTWYHVVVTHDASNNYVMYIDGIAVKSGSTHALDLISATDTIIGALNTAGTWDFDGELDLPIIYNRVLSISEIVLLYREPFCMFERKARTALLSGYAVPIGEDYFRTIDDSVGMGDVMGRTQIQVRTIDDGIGSVDTMSRTQSQIRILVETLGLVDSLRKSETKIFADALGITDEITKTQEFARTIADDIGLVDSITRLMTYARTLAETLGITDTQIISHGHVRAVADELGITDSIIKTAVHARIVADAMGITDDVTRVQTQLRTIADAMGLTDLMSPGQIIVFAEAMGITDAITHTKTQIRTLTDNLGITDDVTRIANYVFAQSDNVGIADAMIRVAVALRTVSDNVGMTDVMSIAELVKAAWAFMIIRQTHN
jgi:hypothetical protein